MLDEGLEQNPCDAQFTADLVMPLSSFSSFGGTKTTGTLPGAEPGVRYRFPVSANDQLLAQSLLAP